MGFTEWLIAEVDPERTEFKLKKPRSFRTGATKYEAWQLSRNTDRLFRLQVVVLPVSGIVNACQLAGGDKQLSAIQAESHVAAIVA